jgi:hypothetical protein
MTTVKCDKCKKECENFESFEIKVGNMLSSKLQKIMKFIGIDQKIKIENCLYKEPVGTKLVLKICNKCLIKQRDN